MITDHVAEPIGVFLPSIDSIKALDGKIVAMLNPEEEGVLTLYSREGRKWGILVDMVNEVDGVKLEQAKSATQSDQLLKSGNVRVSVKIEENRFIGSGRSKPAWGPEEIKAAWTCASFEITDLDESIAYRYGVDLDNRPLESDEHSLWRKDGLLAELGKVVAYEEPSGMMALSTWDGETRRVWAQFDVLPLPGMIFMRRHMISATSIEMPRPHGAIEVICFLE